MALLFGMSSCSPSLVVRSDYDRQTNFSQYTTYGFYNPSQAPQQDAVLGSKLMLKRLNQAMTREMENRGYKFTANDADILVGFTTDSQNLQSVQSNNNFSPYWNWRFGGMNQVSSRNYEENRVIINLYDGKTKEMVWQGYAKGEINDRGRKDREVLVYDVVGKIMLEYPNRAGFDNMKAISRR